MDLNKKDTIGISSIIKYDILINIITKMHKLRGITLIKYDIIIKRRKKKFKSLNP